jgi:non-ribosomal peptide synthetase component F
MQLYVLDAQLRPMPIGCVGQIAMAGIGVGQGYLNDAAKTAQVFVPNPLADQEPRTENQNKEQTTKNKERRTTDNRQLETQNSKLKTG